MNNKKKTITGLAVVSLLAGGAIATNAFVGKISKALLYRHHRHIDNENELESQYGAKSIYLKNKKGLRLRAISITKEDATKTVIVCHPFALEARDMSMYVPFLQNHISGANILLLDASGHGQSDGYIRGFGIRDLDDILQWNRYILETYGTSHKIIMYGKECGANTILNVAAKHVLKNVVAIISDGAYTSAYDILGYRLERDYKMPKTPASNFIRRKINKETGIDIKESTVTNVKHNDIPTLYFHALEDDFVPVSHVYPLYNANRGEKELFVVKEERYITEVKGDDEFKRTLKEFIKKYTV